MDEFKSSAKWRLPGPSRKIVQINERLRNKLHSIQILKEPFAEEASWLQAAEVVSVKQVKFMETLARTSDFLCSIAAFATSFCGCILPAVCIAFMVVGFIANLGHFSLPGLVNYFVTAVVAQLIFAVLLGSIYSGYSFRTRSRAKWLTRFSRLSTPLYPIVFFLLTLVQPLPSELLKVPAILCYILIQLAIVPIASTIGFAICCKGMKALAEREKIDKNEKEKHLAKEEIAFLNRMTLIEKQRRRAELLLVFGTYTLSCFAMIAIANAIFKFLEVLSLWLPQTDLVGFGGFCLLVLGLSVGYPFVFGLCSKLADHPKDWFLCFISLPCFLALLMEQSHSIAGAFFWLVLTGLSTFVYSRSRHLGRARPVSLPPDGNRLVQPSDLLIVDQKHCAKNWGVDGAKQT